MQCRFCKTELTNVFIDLINSPASNSFLSKEQLNEPEMFYPLKVYTCHKCFLVQIDEYKQSDDIFNSEYVYFSSYSKSWLEHARKYTESMTGRFHFNNTSQVVEIASNDGYLLQYFHGNYTIRLQHDLHACHEVDDIRYMRQHIVPQQEIRLLPTRCQFPGQPHAKEIHYRINTFPHCYFCGIGGRLDTQHRYS